MVAPARRTPLAAALRRARRQRVRIRALEAEVASLRRAVARLTGHTHYMGHGNAYANKEEHAQW